MTSFSLSIVVQDIDSESISIDLNSYRSSTKTFFKIHCQRLKNIKLFKREKVTTQQKVHTQYRIEEVRQIRAEISPIFYLHDTSNASYFQRIQPSAAYRDAMSVHSLQKFKELNSFTHKNSQFLSPRASCNLQQRDDVSVVEFSIILHKILNNNPCRFGKRFLSF